MERKKITFDLFIRGILLVATLIILLMLVKRLSDVLLPFFIAWLIAYMIYPMVTFFQCRLKLKSRIVAIFCTLLTLAGIGVAFFYLLISHIVCPISFVRILTRRC